MTDSEDWSEEERRAFERLDPGLEPPPGSEERLVSALESNGLLPSRKRALLPGRRPPRGAMLWLGTATAVFLFAAGLAAGLFAGRSREARPTGSPRFILFLFGEPTVTVDVERERVAEYKKWASELRRGRFVSGEKLGIGGHHLGSRQTDPHASEGSELRGYFVIEAPDLVRATEVARTCPHLLHGGRILIRPIDPV